MAGKLVAIPASRLRTGWLLWLAWAVVGAIIAFEDSQAGSGRLSAILVGPFWAVWIAWPLLAIWLRITRGPAPEWCGQVMVAGSPVEAMAVGGTLWLEASSLERALGVAVAHLHETPSQARGTACCSAGRVAEWARANGRPGVAQDLER